MKLSSLLVLVVFAASCKQHSSVLQSTDSTAANNPVSNLPSPGGGTNNGTGADNANNSGADNNSSSNTDNSAGASASGNPRISAPKGLSPENNKALSNTNSSIKISWDTVTGAGGYLLRAVDKTDSTVRDTRNTNPASSNFLYIDNFNSNQIDLAVHPGHNYTFWIHAVRPNFKYDDLNSWSPESVVNFSVQTASQPPSNTPPTTPPVTPPVVPPPTTPVAVPAGSYDMAVDFSRPLRAVTYNASGIILSFTRILDTDHNGTYDTWLPADDITKSRLKALKPKLIRNSSDVLISEINYIKNELGATPSWGMSGSSGWRPPNACTAWWSAHEAKIKTTVAQFKAAGYTNMHYDVWNEPDLWTEQFFWSAPKNCSASSPTNLGGWKNCFEWTNPAYGCNMNFVANIDSYFDLYLKSQKTIKSVDPKALVVAPSTGSFNSYYIKMFLDRAIAAHALPEIIGWHELAWNQRNEALHIADHVKEIQAYLATKGIIYGIDQFEVNEYVALASYQFPGDIVAYLSEIDGAGIKFASKSCWPDAACIAGTLNGYLDDNTRQPKGTYWVAKAYADQTGSIMTQIPELPFPVEAQSSYDASTGTASILLGNASWNDVQPYHLLLSKLQSTTVVRNGNVRVIVERIPYTQTAANVIVESNTLMSVSNGEVMITIPNFRKYEAYNVKIQQP